VSLPLVRVQVGFGSAPDDPSQTWTDISDYVRMAEGITFNWGRSDEQGAPEPGRASMLLDNSDGRFSFGYASGAYYPNVVPLVRVRVSTAVDADSEWRPRWDGYADGWPASFQGPVGPQVVRLTATDRLSRFGRLRELRDPLAEEWGSSLPGIPARLDDPSTVLDTGVRLVGGVQWFYGLQEASGSVQAGDTSGQLGRPVLTLTQTGADGTADFGTAGIMPEGTAVRFEPASTNNGLTLSTGSISEYCGGDFSLACQFAWSGTGGVQLLKLGTGGGPSVKLTATSTTVVATLTDEGGTTGTATKTITTNDNAPHHAVIACVGGTIRLIVDEESAATATQPGSMGSCSGLQVGGVTSADAHQVANVTFSSLGVSDARAQELGMLGSGGSERSDVRVARILGWLGVAADLDTDTGSSDIAYQNCGGAQALTLIHQIHEVEQGHFNVTGDGTFLNRGRADRYAAVADVTVTAGQVSPFDFDITVDAADLVNDLQASRPRGATVRVRDESSIAAYGQRAQARTLYADDDTALQEVAGWIVSRWGSVAARVKSITVDLRTQPDVRASAGAAIPGARLAVTGLPATSPTGTSLSLFIEGVSERISTREWSVTWATSSAYMWDATYLDTGAELDDPSTRLTY